MMHIDILLRTLLKDSLEATLNTKILVAADWFISRCCAGLAELARYITRVSTANDSSLKLLALSLRLATLIKLLTLVLRRR
jgi:hypothetical protein